MKIKSLAALPLLAGTILLVFSQSGCKIPDGLGPHVSNQASPTPLPCASAPDRAVTIEVGGSISVQDGDRFFVIRTLDEWNAFYPPWPVRTPPVDFSQNMILVWERGKRSSCESPWNGIREVCLQKNVVHVKYEYRDPDHGDHCERINLMCLSVLGAFAKAVAYPQLDLPVVWDQVGPCPDHFPSPTPTATPTP